MAIIDLIAIGFLMYIIFLLTKLINNKSQLKQNKSSDIDELKQNKSSDIDERKI